MQMFRFIEISCLAGQSGPFSCACNKYWPVSCNEMSVKQCITEKKTHVLIFQPTLKKKKYTL